MAVETKNLSFKGWAKNHNESLGIAKKCMNWLVDAGAISYSEIGTLIPKSGGEYTYFLETYGPLHKFFGPILSFIFAWVTVLLLKPTSLAINSLSFSKYLLEPILAAVGFDLEEYYLYYVLTRVTATVFICIPIFQTITSLDI